MRCEDEELVSKARSNSMSDMKPFIGRAINDALLKILSDGMDMSEKFLANYETYKSIMERDLLPVVYNRCNADRGE